MTVAHHHKRQSFQNPQTSMGAAGHWVKTAGILAPLLIPEITKDTAKQMRWVRIASIATALVSQGFWAHKVHKERQQAHEKIQDYEERLSNGGGFRDRTDREASPYASR